MVKATITRKILHKPIKGINQGTQIGIVEVTKALETQVIAFAPVDKGHLSHSITSVVKKFKALVYTRLNYGIFQEKGTKYMEAANKGKGYFRPAAAIIRSRLSSIMGKDIRKSLRKN